MENFAIKKGCIGSILLGWLLLTGGCSTIDQVALDTTASLLAQGSKDLEREDNWEFLADSLPANIKVLETLLYNDPENDALLATLIKAYAGYGFGVYETLYFEAKLADLPKQDFYRSQAELMYSRALEYGERWLDSRGASIKDYTKASTDGTAQAYLNEHFDGGSELDREGLFFLAQAWGALINLNRAEPALVAQTYLVKELIDWPCTLTPDMQYGLCYVLYGFFETSRPRMLGGNPEKGAKIFVEAMGRFSKNKLISAAYLEYYVIPAMKEDLFHSQMEALRPWLARATPLPIPGEKGETREPGALFNGIAKKRLEAMLRHKEDLF